MSETNQRQFDWGPPASAGDGFREWLVYFFILAFLGAGVWILLDINGRQGSIPAKPTPTTVSSPTNSTMAATQTMAAPVRPVEPAPLPQFYVQLGAFADEASAKEVFAQLTTDGFSPTLAPPDDQYEIHRVLVGPFATEREAEEKAEQLNALGLHCFVSESP